MNADRTEILVLLDESGSMEQIRDDMIGGYNAFLQDQQNAPGDARLSLIKFSAMDWGARGLRDYYRPVFLSMPIGAVQPLGKAGFIPRGNTPLLDAIVKSIDGLGAMLANEPEAQRPAKVVFVIITDGLENASRYQTPQMVRQSIEHQQRKYAWQFVYLGANQDAITVAQEIGISRETTMDWTASSAGAAGTYSAVGAFVNRSRGAVGQSYVNNSFSSAEREQAAGTILVDSSKSDKQ